MKASGLKTKRVIKLRLSKRNILLKSFAMDSFENVMTNALLKTSISICAYIFINFFRKTLQVALKEICVLALISFIS